RLFGAATYSHDFTGVGPTSVGLYIEGRSAGNGSYVINGDMNGDGATTNDLIYIPRNTSEMNFVSNRVIVGKDTTIYTPAQQVAAWDAFISHDPYLSNRRAGHAQRNAVFLPMVSRAALSISQDARRSPARPPHRRRGSAPTPRSWAAARRRRPPPWRAGTSGDRRTWWRGTRPRPTPRRSSGWRSRGARRTRR